MHFRLRFSSGSIFYQELTVSGSKVCAGSSLCCERGVVFCVLIQFILKPAGTCSGFGCVCERERFVIIMDTIVLVLKSLGSGRAA